MSEKRQNWRVARLQVHCDLVAARRAKKMRQVDVAEKMGISLRTFQRFENGDGDCSADELFQWAAILGVAIILSAPQSDEVLA